LIANALQHGDAAQRVEVSIDGSGARELTVEIANSGVIPAEILEHIFEPFRAGSENPKTSRGLGLGLHIVERIVNAHGGSIQARSDALTGTAFHFSLPRQPPSAGLKLRMGS
jgi:signal transduction histidine kinase